MSSTNESNQAARLDHGAGLSGAKLGVLIGLAVIGAAIPELRSALAADDETIDEIVVTADGSQVELSGAYAGGQVARGGRVGIFGNIDIMDAPFASSNFTAELMLEQQAESVADVLLNDPVVRLARGFGNFQEVYVIRGFPTFSDDMMYNGIYGILPRQYVAAELLERVEVFRGANAFINGAAPGGSSLGGAVNLVPKRAADEPLSRLTFGFESDSQGYGAVDVSRRFGPEKSTGARVNIVRRDGETAVEAQERELTVASLGIDYSGQRGRLSADLGFHDHHIDAPRPSVTPIGGIASPPDASSNFAQLWTLTDERQLFGVVRGEYDVTDNTSAWTAIGMRNGEEFNILSNPSATPDGNTSALRFDNVREDDIVSADVGVRSDFRTGTVGHRLTVSASDFSVESKNAFAFSSFAGFSGNLYNPTRVPPPPPTAFLGGDMSAPHVTFTTDTTSFAIADMLSFLDDSLLVTLGVRHQNIDTESFDFNTGASTSRYDENKLTPVAGIVIKRGEQISFYGSYIEGLIPGDIAPLTSGGSPVVNAGEVFEPYQAEQVEVGVKYDGGSFGTTLSAFTLSRPTAFVEDNVFSVSGEQRNQGLELSIFGQPRDDVRLLGGLTFVEAELDRTQNNQFDGNDAVGTPDFQVNLNVEWDLPVFTDLTLDARGIYTSSQWADAANTIKVPSWTRFDLGARYTTEIGDRLVSIRARLDNVADSEEWVSVGGFPGSNYLVLGLPRTLAVTASVDF